MPQATEPWTWDLGGKGILGRSDSFIQEIQLIFPDSVLFPVLF